MRLNESNIRKLGMTMNKKLIFKKVAVVLFTILSSHAVTAQEIAVGLGADDILDRNRRSSDGSVLATSAIGAVFELKTTPVLDYKNLSLTPTYLVQLDTGKDYYFGAGLTARFEFGQYLNKFFSDFGISAGLHTENSTDSKIKNDLKFRSTIGLGYKLENDTALIFSIDHMLDTNLKNHNPGSETIFIRYSKDLH